MCSEGSNTISHQDITQIEEMRANPFASRICELFSEDGTGCLNFEKFLKLISIFSASTPAEVKMAWAFALWDFDGDDLIGSEDIREGIDLITHAGTIPQPSAQIILQRKVSSVGLNEDEIDQLVAQVGLEIDPDNYGLPYHDFRGILLRMPDFINNFKINI
ncbi:hypothetical protein O6H91_18G053600 [Diphasiastrum complanatum]|uniref:Uncharacterized protein n=2 Tax=Diphasiastrum complanatum TaxID=34168 RepID=A0ACC2B2H2_DIPCM|nr:hypothetical protein O6H91_18G044400 [Diphasiastrum complanatum]KAJ7523539.1 hypothetical protein O6H91_18G053600 [Diphasiastrum complanatum]